MVRTLSALSLLAVAAASQAVNVAVFGDNNLDELLNANGYTATVYSDADIAAGLANGADAFIYNRDGAGFGSDLSAGAAAQVIANFGGGNTVGIFTDITDSATVGGGEDTLLLNATGWASANKGFLGLFNGAGWALENGLMTGTSFGENYNGAPATYNVVQSHPVTAGGSFLSAQDEYYSFNAAIPSANVLAVDNQGNVLVAVEAVPEPGTIAAIGLGLAAVARRRRKA